MTGQIIHKENDLRPYFREMVEEAVCHKGVDVTDVSQFYLVNMLSNFAKTEQLFDWEDDHYEETPLAVLLAKALHSDCTTRIKVFKKIGDVSLYIAGYFSDHIDSKLVDIDYYISMGEGAYQNLAGIFVDERTFSELYEELSKRFPDFVDILSIVRNTVEVSSNVELVRLYERWLRTGDPKIRERLEKEGLVPQKHAGSKNH